MDWWIVNQLRASTLMDLREFIPENYFMSEVTAFKLNNHIENSEYYSSEFKWEYLATKLGKKLLFESTVIMSPRQVSASELLMFLGLLAGIEAMLGVTKQISNKAQLLNVSDSNAGEVAKQLSIKQLPTALKNVREALEQYLRYFEPSEAQPFLPLINSSKYQEKTVDLHPNISLLMDRMINAFENEDPSGVLHASASIFETMAKSITAIDTVQSKSLGSFFERYRKESMIPQEILNYIQSIYIRRNTEPLAGHGSTALPEITLKEATVIIELTKALVRIEGTLQIFRNYQDD
ncbi:MAG: hypothetical protein A4S08_08600 [Proteobacteria bacterium SG_bin4]|nr:MAG: hypothetical protein A4S08_08600 [Proteobacteria bacterium SG_bin4]